MEELKQLERESVTLSANIEEVKSNKASLMDQIVNVERQALLWEKKIQLDKETKEALDPTVGQAETQSMEREIHRMSLRLEALKREEERLSIEMERAVNKRSSIELRFKTKPPDTSIVGTATTKANLDVTQAGLKKRITTLKKDARTLSDETTRYTGVIEERKMQLQLISSDLDKMNAEYSENEKFNSELQRQINEMLYQKQRNNERVSYCQTYLKKLRELMSSGVEHASALQAERRLLAATQALENVQDIARDLQRLHPHLADVLERVYKMTDPGIDSVYNRTQ
jgi:chromosome segregation ATPase